MTARQHDTPDCAGRNGAHDHGKHTPGPWDYVPGTEHHGPYVTTEYGSTVADCYYMSNPYSLSVRNGGDSKPINHMREMADANARLIAAAPDMLEALKQAEQQIDYGQIDAAHRIIIAAIAKADGRA